MFFFKSEKYVKYVISNTEYNYDFDESSPLLLASVSRKLEGFGVNAVHKSIAMGRCSI